MKSILLDSHVFLWAITADSQLGKSAKRIIETTPNIYVSSLSFFELQVKQSRKKLKLPDDLERLAISQNFRVLDLTPKQLSNYHIFSNANTDPFDNALLSVAEIQRLQFLTADERIIDLGSQLHWIIDGRK